MSPVRLASAAAPHPAPGLGEVRRVTPVAHSPRVAPSPRGQLGASPKQPEAGVRRTCVAWELMLILGLCWAAVWCSRCLLCDLHCTLSLISPFWIPFAM